MNPLSAKIAGNVVILPFELPGRAPSAGTFVLAAVYGKVRLPFVWANFPFFFGFFFC